MTNKQLIKESAEAYVHMHTLKLQIFIYFFTTGSYVILGICLYTIHKNYNYMVAYVLIYFIGMTCMYTPLIIYCVNQYRSLFASSEKYIFCEKAYFSITITDSQETYYVKTKRFYHTNWLKPHYEDYYQKKVIVGYNPVTEKVILIKKKETDPDC